VPTANSSKLAGAALIALAAITETQKAGVVLLELVLAVAVQRDLWISPDTPRSKALMRAAASLDLSGILIGSGMPMVGCAAAAFGAFTLVC
jgi:hypothetical protein